MTVSSKIEKEQPKYYDRGVLVESLTPNGEKLISIYDYFCKYPEDSFSIHDFIERKNVKQEIELE